MSAMIVRAVRVLASRAQVKENAPDGGSKNSSDSGNATEESTTNLSDARVLISLSNRVETIEGSNDSVSGRECMFMFGSGPRSR